MPAGLHRLEKLVGQENLRPLTVAAPMMLCNGGALPQSISLPRKRGLREVFAGVGLSFGLLRSYHAKKVKPGPQFDVTSSRGTVQSSGLLMELRS